MLPVKNLRKAISIRRPGHGRGWDDYRSNGGVPAAQERGEAAMAALPAGSMDKAKGSREAIHSTLTVGDSADGSPTLDKAAVFPRAAWAAFPYALVKIGPRRPVNRTFGDHISSQSALTATFPWDR